MTAPRVSEAEPALQANWDGAVGVSERPLVDACVPKDCQQSDGAAKTDGSVAGQTNQTESTFLDCVDTSGSVPKRSTSFFCSISSGSGITTCYTNSSSRHAPSSTAERCNSNEKSATSVRSLSPRKCSQYRQDSLCSHTTGKKSSDAHACGGLSGKKDSNVFYTTGGASVSVTAIAQGRAAALSPDADVFTLSAGAATLAAFNVAEAEALKSVAVKKVGPSLSETVHGASGGHINMQTVAVETQAVALEAAAETAGLTTETRKMMTLHCANGACDSAATAPHVAADGIGDLKCFSLHNKGADMREHQHEHHQQQHHAEQQEGSFPRVPVDIAELEQQQRKPLQVVSGNIVRPSHDEKGGVQAPPGRVLQCYVDTDIEAVEYKEVLNLKKAEENGVNQGTTSLPAAGDVDGPGMKVAADDGTILILTDRQEKTVATSHTTVPFLTVVDETKYAKAKGGMMLCKAVTESEEKDSGWKATQQAPAAVGLAASSPRTQAAIAGSVEATPGVCVISSMGAGARVAAATAGPSPQSNASEVLRSLGSNSCDEILSDAGEGALLGRSSSSGTSDRSSLFGLSARRSLSRISPVEAAASATSATAAVGGVTRCSPRHIRKAGAILVERQQQQEEQQRRSVLMPFSGTGPTSFTSASSLPQSAHRSAGASGGSTNNKNISLKRKTCTSSGKTRSGGGRCVSNSARKETDANSIRFDASWFLPQDDLPVHSDFQPASTTSQWRPRKRLKFVQKACEVVRNWPESAAFFPVSSRPELTADGCFWGPSGQEEFLLCDAPGAVDVAGLEYRSYHQRDTRRRFGTNSSSYKTAGDSAYVRTWGGPDWERRQSFIEGDSLLTSSSASEDDEELDGYLSDVEAAARALEDPTSFIRNAQPHERPHCCVCGLPTRPAFSCCDSVSNDARSGSKKQGGGGSRNVSNNNKGLAAWEPLCACVPRLFGENTLQGRAGKDALLYPSAATPLRYTLHTLVLKPPSGSDSFSTNSHSISQAASCVASTSGCSTGNTGCSAGCSGYNNIQSSIGSQISVSNQALTERHQDGDCDSGFPMGGKCSMQSSNSSCSRAGTLPRSCRNDSGSTSSSINTGDSSSLAIQNGGSDFSCEGGRATGTGFQKKIQRFCRWRDLATLQSFCAPLEQLQDSLAATVASAAAAGAAAGRSVVFLPRLFWDRESDCYVASCLGYARVSESNETNTDSSSGSDNNSGGGDSTVAVGDGDVELRLLQKRFSVGFLGDAKAHFYACMWLNWHHEQANAIQQKQQQQREELMEQQKQQPLVHSNKGKNSAMSQTGPAGQVRKQQGHGVAASSSSGKDTDRGSNKYGAQGGSSHWRQQKGEADAAGSEEETEEERKARLRQESLARQKRHKLERQQWRRQQARLARLLLQQQQQQQQQQPQQQPQRHNTKQHSPQQQGHASYAAAGANRAGSTASGEQLAVATALTSENRTTRATTNSNTSLHFHQQRSSGEATTGSVKAAAGVTGEKAKDVATQATGGRGATPGSGGRKTDGEVTAGGTSAGAFSREAGGPLSSDQNSSASVDHRASAASAAADAFNRGTLTSCGTAGGGLQGAACSASPVGLRLHRRSDGAQTPPLARGSSRESSASSHKANRISSTPGSITNSRSSGSSSTTASNRSDSTVVGSTSSRGGTTTSASQSSRSSSLRGGNPSKQTQSSFVSAVAGKAAANTASGQTLPSPAGAGSVGAANAAAQDGTPPVAALRADGSSTGGSSGAGACVVSTAAGNIRRAVEVSVTERADWTPASGAHGKGKGRVTARKSSTTGKAAAVAPDKQQLSKGKTRSSPSFPASAAGAAASGATGAASTGMSASSWPTATTTTGPAVTTSFVSTAVAQSSAAGNAEPECTSGVVSSGMNAAAYTRSAIRAASVFATAPSLPTPMSVLMVGGSGAASGGYGDTEGAGAGSERGDTATANTSVGSAERRCRAARTSPRCLSGAAGGAGGGGVSLAAAVSPAAPAAGSGATATSALLSGSAETEKKSTSPGAYIPLLCVPPSSATVSGGGGGFPLTGAESTPAPAGVVSNTRGGSGRGRSTGAVVLGTPEKLKISTRAHQRSAASTAVQSPPTAGVCNGHQQQQGHWRGERAGTVSVVSVVGGSFALGTGGGGSRMTSGPNSGKDTDPMGGIGSSRQPSEEQKTGGGKAALIDGKSASMSTTEAATSQGPAAGGTTPTGVKCDGKPSKNSAHSTGGERRWGSAARQRQSRRQRETRR